MTYFWETVDTIAPDLGWPHFGPFHLAVLAVFLLLGAVLCHGYCGMDTDKRRRWRRSTSWCSTASPCISCSRSIPLR